MLGPPRRTVSASTSPTRAEVELLVRTFYRAAAMDDRLGPIFEAAAVDWPSHIETVTDFWMDQLFGTRQLHGNPLRAHEPVARKIPFRCRALRTVAHPLHRDRRRALRRSRRRARQGPRREDGAGPGPAARGRLLAGIDTGRGVLATRRPAPGLSTITPRSRRRGTRRWWSRTSTSPIPSHPVPQSVYQTRSCTACTCPTVDDPKPRRRYEADGVRKRVWFTVSRGDRARCAVGQSTETTSTATSSSCTASPRRPSTTASTSASAPVGPAATTSAS